MLATPLTKLGVFRTPITAIGVAFALVFGILTLYYSSGGIIITASLVNSVASNFPMSLAPDTGVSRASYIEICSALNRSDACKSIYGQGLQFNDPRQGLSTIVSLDLRKYSSVIDMRCRFVYRYAYFHVWRNCILEMIGLIHHAVNLIDENSIVIIERYLKDILDTVGIAILADHHIIEAGSKDTAVNIDCQELLFYNASSAPLSYRMKTFRELFIKKELENNKVEDSILYLKRVGTGREIYPENHLLGNLSYSFPHHTLGIFYGNEGLESTIQMFRSASIIIGGHGAGIINVIFSDPSALLIEITRRVPSTGEIWRSNLYPEVVHSVRCACKIIVSTTVALRHQGLSVSEIDEGLMKQLSFVVEPHDILGIISQISRFVQAITDMDQVHTRNQTCPLNDSLEYSGI